MRVLIVEDDMVIAGAVAPTVTAAGCQLVGLAAARDTAVALLASADVDLALIDLCLADGWTGMDVARAAADNEVLAVFVTANPAMLPDDLGGAFAVLEKPYAQRTLTSALRYLAKRIDGERTPQAPAGLRLAAPISVTPESQPAAAAVLPS